MSRKKTMSLRTRLLLLVSFIVLLGFAITLTLLSRQTGKLQHRTALQYTTQLAANEGAKATRHLEHAMDAARTIAHALKGLKADSLAERSNANALLKGVLHENPSFLAVWTAWEPNAFDGQDSSFSGGSGHDATGAATCPIGAGAATARCTTSHWSITKNPAWATFIYWPKPADKKPCWSLTTTSSLANQC